MHAYSLYMSESAPLTPNLNLVTQVATSVCTCQCRITLDPVFGNLGRLPRISAPLAPNVSVVSRPLTLEVATGSGRARVPLAVRVAGCLHPLSASGTMTGRWRWQGPAAATQCHCTAHGGSKANGHRAPGGGRLGPRQAPRGAFSALAVVQCMHARLVAPSLAIYYSQSVLLVLGVHIG
jgi:hypothetical protein